jgi:hypothetical protein
MKFTDLVTRISGIDGAARLSAGQTLQRILSLRNWLMGAYIVEFEQAGEDRATYGQNLMERLAASLQESGCKGLSVRNLKNFRQVALAYPELDLAALAQQSGLALLQIRQTSAESAHFQFATLTRRAGAPQFLWRDAGWTARLFTTMTFFHLLELSRIDDVTRRAFYELHV